MFSYTVLKVESHQITVEFPDETWAEIPIYAGESQEVIEKRITQYYHPPTEGFENDSEIPFEVGKEYTAEEVSRKNKDATRFELEEEARTSQVYTFTDLRRLYYPGIEEQMLAMYHARQGITDMIENLDKKIEQVNLQFPADMEPISQKEYEELITEASEI